MSDLAEARIVIEKPCEHGQFDTHETPECWAHKGVHTQSMDCYCPGGSRQVVSGATIRWCARHDCSVLNRGTNCAFSGLIQRDTGDAVKEPCIIVDRILINPEGET